MLGLIPGAFASQWTTEVGYDELVKRFEAKRVVSLGAGVAISQVEAPSSGGGYLPQAAHGNGSFNGSDAFEGKAFRRRSNGTEASDHARVVGHFLYGVEPLDSFGAVSLTPGVTAVDLYKAGVKDYLGRDFLKAGLSEEPARESNAIQNHSWSGKVGSASMDYLDDVLQRLDYTIVRDGYLCVAALKNGADQPIPPLVASAYNVLSVGRSDGQHARGTTHADLSGPGRGKPDLVAPLSATSFATSVVSSAAALLIDEASLGTGKVLPDSTRPEVLRALLMAGASKAPFPFWRQTPERPFDAVYGAGQIDIERSHEILTRGAWKSEMLGKGETWELDFEVNREGSAFSTVLTWNRQIGLKRGRVKSESVANMAMELYAIDAESGERRLMMRSDSAVENREHLYTEHLPHGRYLLSIETSRSVRFGLAWHLESASTHQSLALEWLGEDQLLARGMKSDRAYRLQSSFNLEDWEDVQPVWAPSLETSDLPQRIGIEPMVPIGGMKFYRLVETIRSSTP